MTTHISVDTETWGKRPGFDARSLGAVVFNPREGFVRLDTRPDIPIGEGHDFYAAFSNKLQGSYSSSHYTQKDLDKLDYTTGDSRQYPLKRDNGTVDWWYRQTPEAQAAFVNPIDLREGLMKFSAWLASVGVNPRDEKSGALYAHGAAFDIPIIEAWYYAVDLPVPWHYRAARDTRSIFDMVDIDDHSAFVRQHSVGIFHHARDDAATQAHAICKAYAMRSSWKG
jgi:hypothetical protein